MLPSSFLAPISVFLEETSCPDALGATIPISLDLSLANCYFAHDSLGFSVLLPFFDAQSGHSLYPLVRHLGPAAWTWRRPFPSRGVASPEAPTPDRESLPASIAESKRLGPHPCRLADPLGASNSSSPFRNCCRSPNRCAGNKRVSFHLA
jgi:hypothetical protein